MTNAPVSRLQELSKAIEPYAEHWRAWTRSRHCFLGQKHIFAAELYLELRSYDSVAKAMNTTSVEVFYTLVQCISRLKLFIGIYERWQADRYRIVKISAPALQPTFPGQIHLNHTYIDDS